VTGINWTLNNNNALVEIPEGAWYYSVDITNCLRTRFFVQGIGPLVYAARDATNNYTFTTLAYASTLAGIAVDITGLQSYAQGYVFSQGDQCRLYVGLIEYTLSIIGQVGQYIICQLQNIGDLTDGKGQFEIYTPYQRQADEPYNEVGQIFPISNPGTSARTYGTITGTISGDIYVISRGGYLTEAMNPNDQYYTRWFTNAGRPDFIDYIGQARHQTSIAYSNTFIAGAMNNGLSTFDALDVQDIGPDFGPLQKIQLASKVAKIGTVMLGICSGPATASIYLSENTLISQTGDSVVAQANAVIGSIHELKGGFGTLNPESVIEFRGNIYWFDVQNGMIIQYADNGLFPISNYKTNRFWNLFAQQYKSLTAAQIEALGSRPFVFAGIDPHHGEVLFTVPRVLTQAPNGTLPDYPSIQYPFDIYDGQSKTMVYKLYTDPNHWQGSYSFAPEFMMYVENELFSFVGGQLYVHNQQSNYCQYYGTQYQPFVAGVSNQAVNLPKSYNNISSESSAPPLFGYLFTNYSPLYVQRSDLVNNDFVYKENIYYAPILRNKYDPAFGTNHALALLAGEKMRSTALYYMAQWDASQGPVTVKFINIGYTPSLGQKVQT
jgi:hypothetical protein